MHEQRVQNQTFSDIYMRSATAVTPGSHRCFIADTSEDTALRKSSIQIWIMESVSQFPREFRFSANPLAVTGDDEEAADATAKEEKEAADTVQIPVHLYTRP